MNNILEFLEKHWLISIIIGIIIFTIICLIFDFLIHIINLKYINTQKINDNSNYNRGNNWLSAFEIPTNELEIDKLRKTILKLRDEIDKLRKTILKLRDEIDKLRKTILKLRDEIDELKKTILKLENEKKEILDKQIINDNTDSIKLENEKKEIINDNTDSIKLSMTLEQVQKVNSHLVLKEKWLDKDNDVIAKYVCEDKFYKSKSLSYDSLIFDKIQPKYIIYTFKNNILIKIEKGISEYRI